VNAGKEQQPLSFDNSAGAKSTKMGGFTVPLSCTAKVKPCGFSNTLVFCHWRTHVDFILDQTVHSRGKLQCFAWVKASRLAKFSTDGFQSHPLLMRALVSSALRE
jgi:hypothetical protein